MGRRELSGCVYMGGGGGQREEAKECGEGFG